MNKPLVTLMQDASVRKALGQRIKQLRKEKSWTQKVLANQLGTSYAQLNKYESGLNTPPLDRLLLLAEVLHTSTDYLIGGHKNDEVPIYNNRLIKRFQSIEEFEPEERDLVIKVLDALIAKNSMEATLKSFTGSN